MRAIFGPFWVISGHFLGHFVAYLDKFAESSIFFAAQLGSWGLLLECMGGPDSHECYHVLCGPSINGLCGKVTLICLLGIL